MGIRSIFKENLAGYNFKEKAYVIGGATIGALAPVAVTKYLIGSCMESEHALHAGLFAWGVSILANIIPFFINPKYAPITWGGLAGTFIGNSLAESSKTKREKRAEIKDVLSKIEKEISSEEINQEALKGLVNKYRGHKWDSKLFGPKMKKYDNALANLTKNRENLKSLPIA